MLEIFRFEAGILVVAWWVPIALAILTAMFRHSSHTEIKKHDITTEATKKMMGLVEDHMKRSKRETDS